jgi:hypothetical protein
LRFLHYLRIAGCKMGKPGSGAGHVSAHIKLSTKALVDLYAKHRGISISQAVGELLEQRIVKRPPMPSQEAAEQQAVFEYKATYGGGHVIGQTIADIVGRFDQTPAGQDYIEKNSKKKKEAADPGATTGSATPIDPVIPTNQPNVPTPIERPPARAKHKRSASQQKRP